MAGLAMPLPSGWLLLIAAERVDDARTSGALRARADEALYAAKRTGRDRALLWAPGVRSLATPATRGRSRTHPAQPRPAAS